MAGAYEALDDHYRRRDLAARAWKAAGGRVVGYVCETVPEALIAAAGFLPWRIAGDPDIGEAMLDRYVRPLLPKGFSNARYGGPDYVSSITAQALAGRFDFLDVLVVSNTRKSILLIQNQLREAKAAYPELKLPEVWILDRAQTPFLTSTMFNRDRVLAFKARLESSAGRTITDDDLRTAIAEANETHAILRRVQAARAADRPRLSGAEALRFYGVARLTPKAEFNALAARALDELEARPARSGSRLYFGGSPLDHPQLYELIEAAGGLIVADDQAWGDRAAEPDVDPGGDPLAALIEHYERLAPLTYPLSALASASAERARAASAAGAVFNVCRNDDIKLWEVPDEIAALADAGVPSLHLKEQPYRIAEAGVLQSQIKAFLDRLRGGRA